MPIHRLAFFTAVFAASLAAAPILPGPAVTDGSVTVTAEDIPGTSLFYLNLTSGGVTERYAFHNLDRVNSLAVSNGRVALFAQLMADAVGPLALTFGNGGCAPGACYSNLHTYDWLGWQSNQIAYPTGYGTLPVATGGGVTFTGFSPAGILTASIRAERTGPSIPGPQFIDFSYSWNLAPTAPAQVEHMPEPAAGVLLAAGLAAFAVVRRRARR